MPADILQLVAIPLCILMWCFIRGFFRVLTAYTHLAVHRHDLVVGTKQRRIDYMRYLSERLTENADVVEPDEGDEAEESGDAPAAIPISSPPPQASASSDSSANAAPAAVDDAPRAAA